MVMNNRWYFAYGSNLNTNHWRQWCRGEGVSPELIRFRSIARLPDRALAFDCRSVNWGGGVLNLRERVGQVTAGVVFEVAPGGWEALDASEGAPGTCQRKSA